MLFPLPESGFLRLDLLGKLLPECLFFFLELGVVAVTRLGFAEFAGLHLLLAVVLVVKFFGCGDEVEHVRANQEGSKFPEIAVILILNCRWK